MPRNHARILTSIWDDDDFRQLEPEAQRVYFLLVSQPDLTSCGALPYLPGRWARLSSGTGEQEIVNAISLLEDCRFVLVDVETQELIIRTFVVHDGGLGNPKMRGAVKSALKALHSRRLRAEIVHVIPEQHRAEIADGLSMDCQSIGDPTDARTAMRFNAEVGGRRQSPVPLASESSSLRAAEDIEEPPAKRARRLPDDFEITDAMLEWAEQRIPGIDLVHHTERFENYWRSKPGKGGTQLDWIATWRNWMLKEYEARPLALRPPGVKPAPEQVRRVLDDEIPPCPLGECDGRGWIELEGDTAAHRCPHLEAVTA